MWRNEYLIPDSDWAVSVAVIFMVALIAAGIYWLGVGLRKTRKRTDDD